MPTPKVVTVTKIVKTEVPIVARPKQVKLNDIKIYVVSKRNYAEFVKVYAKKNGADSYIALSVKDYENLALNFAERWESSTIKFQLNFIHPRSGF